MRLAKGKVLKTCRMMGTFYLSVNNPYFRVTNCTLFLGSMLPQYMALSVSFVTLRLSKKNLGHF